jgi:antitoxin PrlF
MARGAQLMTVGTAITTARVRARGQLTLPSGVRDALHIAEGDEVEFTLHEDGTITVRGTKRIPADQAWFWAPEWQAGEREADEDIAAGRGSHFGSTEEFLSGLDREVR